MTEQEKLARFGPVVATFASKRKPDKKYQVRQKDAQLFCNCTGWATSAPAVFAKVCRHTRAAYTRGLCRLPAKVPGLSPVMYSTESVPPSDRLVARRPALEPESELNARVRRWLTKAAADAWVSIVRIDGRNGIDPLVARLAMEITKDGGFTPTQPITRPTPQDRGTRVIILEDE